MMKTFPHIKMLDSQREIPVKGSPDPFNPYPASCFSELPSVIFSLIS
jgi:hypothetical protein